MLHQSVNQTNKHIEQNQGRYGRERDAKLAECSEIQAVFRLLYLSVVIKSGRLNVKELWSSSALGVEIF